VESREHTRSALLDFSRWLLLGQAVQGAEAEDQIHSVDSDHGAVAKKLA
jgi:hypothetical protein